MKPDAEFQFYCARQGKVCKKPSVKASTARAFLQSMKERANGQRSTLNPKLTRLESWQALSKSISSVDPDKAINSRIYKNILREFVRGGR